MRGAAPAQRAQGAEARPAAARSPRRLATSSRGPHGIRKFPDISGHVRSYQEGRPRGRRGRSQAYGTPPTGASGGGQLRPGRGPPGSVRQRHQTRGLWT